MFPLLSWGARVLCEALVACFPSQARLPEHRRHTCRRDLPAASEDLPRLPKGFQTHSKGFLARSRTCQGRS